jgi:hypothetical protein
MQINWVRLFLLLSPILAIQLALGIYALLDLSRRQRVRGSRGLWAVLLVVAAFAMPTGILVAGLYLAWGRDVETEHDPD